MKKGLKKERLKSKHEAWAQADTHAVLWQGYGNYTRPHRMYLENEFVVT